MGLDVYVTSFSRFMTGDFTSSLENFLTPDAASRVERVGSPKPSESLGEVREQIARIRRILKKSARIEATWDEESRFQYTTQFDYRAYAFLRAFAASEAIPDVEPDEQAPEQMVSNKTLCHALGEIQYSMLSRGRPPYPKRRVETGNVRPFVEGEDPLFHRSFVKVCEGEKECYPHLIHHSDNGGCWVPIPFQRPLILDQDSYQVVGSSIGLLEELNRLGAILGMERDWAQIERGASVAPEGDPLRSVKYGWAVLHAAARLSVQHRLPIIFDG